MRLTILLLGSCLLLTSSLRAAPSRLDSLTVGARTYTNVTILGANVTDLYFTHSAGISNVKLKHLPPELQKQFGFDPNAAEAAERKQSEEDKLYQKALATSISTQAQKPRAGQGAANASQENLADPISDLSLLGKRAPALTVEKWLSDRPSLEGKFVLVAFWAPWSSACRQYIPEWNAIQKQFASDLVVVGLCAEPAAKVSEMTEPNIEFASAIDTKSKLSGEAGITSIPCVLLLDPQRTVRYQGHPGAITAQKLQTLIAGSQQR